MPDLDMTAVERLRQHMKLSQGDMAELFSVTRVTYHNWVRGKPVRQANADRVRAVVRRLVTLIKGGLLPPGLHQLPSKERVQRIVALMEA